ncbi:MAG: hypothetical protein CVU44_20960 [Chloroflexi bacterium HGW-Chloroflexi-6]|nr:MAG: hypothetical protein CVU44_20960 [Chloroflexi bacterium HGW-Chloroflexi-6]
MDGLNWKRCPGGHVLGEIVREAVVYNGRRMYATRLKLFRQAMTEAEADVIPGSVAATIEGTAPELYCSICDATTPWIIGQHETERLVERWVTKRRTLVQG